MKFFLKPKSIWKAIEADCEKATRSIIMEQYILHNDCEGEALLTLLTKAVKRGVKVQLILDYIGSYSIKSSPAFKAFRDAGGEVLFDRPLWWVHIFFPQTWFPRNHCKTTVIDDEVAYVGGACFAEYMHNWRDTQMRLTGHLVPQIKKYSMNHWKYLSNKKKQKHAITQATQADIQYVMHNPLIRQRPLFRMLHDQIQNARESIYIASPYFFPPKSLRHALYKAQKRGVAVTLLLSKKTDYESATTLTRALLFGWLNRGFRVWFYQPVIMHAKYAIIDDKWATVGSNNFDHLSMRFNREANLVIHSPEIINTLKDHFNNDLQHSHPATMQDWRELSWRKKCMGKLALWVYKLF